MQDGRNFKVTSNAKTSRNSHGDMKVKVTREDLYHFCADYGLMLSWGIPITRVLSEMEDTMDNLLLKKVSVLLFDVLFKGKSQEEPLKKFPDVFKPAFVRWIRIGEKFGILDQALLQMAGLMRFDHLLMGKNPAVEPREVGKFLMRFARLLRNKRPDEQSRYQNDTPQKSKTGDSDVSPDKWIPDDEQFTEELLDWFPLKLSGESAYNIMNPGKLTSSLKELTDNRVILEWIDKISNGEDDCRLFGDSMKCCHIYPIYRKIANPVFWYILDTAEDCGYLPWMLEILGLYLIDRKNLFPSEEILEIDGSIFGKRESSIEIARNILETIELSGDKKAIIIIKDRLFNIFIDDGETELGQLIGLPGAEVEKLRSVISSLKILLELDEVERRIPQKVVTGFSTNNRNYLVSADVAPPYPFPNEEMSPEEYMKLEPVETIEIKFTRIEDVE